MVDHNSLLCAASPAALLACWSVCLPGTTLGYMATAKEEKKKEPELAAAAEEADAAATVVVTPAAA